MRPSRRTPSSTLRAALRLSTGALILGLIAPAPVLAQTGDEAADAASVSLSGVVRDAVSGAPVGQVWVHLEDDERGVVTGPDGRFTLEAVSPPLPSHVVRLVFERIGYETLLAGALAIPGQDALDIRMDPDPVVLEGFEIVTDRFERRRNGTPVAVRLMDAERIRSSAARDLLDVLEGSGGLPLQSCDLEYCVLRRGRWIQPRVYLDEAPLLGGLDMLEGFPPHRVHMVEIYAGGSMIRVYSDQFMETAARQKLLPINIW